MFSSIPINHKVYFFGKIPVVLESCTSSSRGWGGGRVQTPLHLPPRSTPNYPNPQSPSPHSKNFFWTYMYWINNIILHAPPPPPLHCSGYSLQRHTREGPSQKVGLSLRGGGQGFSPGTMNVALLQATFKGKWKKNRTKINPQLFDSLPTCCIYAATWNLSENPAKGLPFSVFRYIKREEGIS